MFQTATADNVFCLEHHCGFHFRRASELYPMSLTELITWREKALRRSGNTNE
ncbi:GpE family phage tail protein [Escherichia coli]|nr:GpE family phage tail protein [Escherichia coli]